MLEASAWHADRAARWEFRMVYSPHPPYEILQTRTIDFATMQRLRRLAHWDLIANSGNFIESTPLSLVGPNESAFARFMALSDWLYATAGQKHGCAREAARSAVHASDGNSPARSGNGCRALA